MKKIFALFFAPVILSANVFAGGDDRDAGPVEAFDSMAPITEKVVVSDQNPSTMTLSGVNVSAAAHNACKGELGLSESNIARFVALMKSGGLYNTGPLEELGTEFTPNRWDDYLNCVKNY